MAQRLVVFLTVWSGPLLLVLAVPEAWCLSQWCLQESLLHHLLLTYATTTADPSLPLILFVIQRRNAPSTPLMSLDICLSQGKCWNRCLWERPCPGVVAAVGDVGAGTCDLWSHGWASGK